MEPYQGYSVPAVGPHLQWHRPCLRVGTRQKKCTEASAELISQGPKPHSTSWILSSWLLNRSFVSGGQADTSLPACFKTDRSRIIIFVPPTPSPPLINRRYWSIPSLSERSRARYRRNVISPLSLSNYASPMLCNSSVIDYLNRGAGKGAGKGWDCLFGSA